MGEWKIKLKILLWTSMVLLAPNGSNAQDTVKQLSLNYTYPDIFTIASLTVSGTQTLDQNLVAIMSGLTPGKEIKIPGEEIRRAAEKLWQKGWFSEVQILSTGIVENKIFLNISVEERPKLSSFSFKGLGKSDQNSLRDEIDLKRGKIITENLVNQTKTDILDYFKEKGFYQTQVRIKVENEINAKNKQIFRISVDKGKKIKLQDIEFVGLEKMEAKTLRKEIKPKRKYKKINPFASSKFVESKYKETKPNIISTYRQSGFRDAQIIKDSIYVSSQNRVHLKLWIKEGQRYYIRNIKWVGNTLYRDGQLDTILGIVKGDLYDERKLNENLQMNADGLDISGIYMDNGYLFFQVNPVEVAVENDSIDLEIRIYEGKQATINRVSVLGNDKTSDHVIIRSLRTLPGEKFSRSDIQRSMRELAALGYFNPETLDVNPIPNPASGTVDLEYKVEEKPSDQIEASGGWGGLGFGGFVGSVGLQLTNFSASKLFEKGGWTPLPSGDGQRLTLRMQSNGLGFQSYNFSFTEPWLGGRKPNSFTGSVFHSVQSNFRPVDDPNRATLKTTGITFALGTLLTWPDDYFTLGISATYQKYKLTNGDLLGFGTGSAGFGYSDGFSNNINFNFNLSRNSTDHPIYPQNGSNFKLNVQATPPYSSFAEKDYNRMEPEEKFKWVEYHKWKFDAQWFSKLFGKLVLAPQLRFGLIGIYNQNIGFSPFERFRVGGSGLNGFTLYGTDIVSQRGYDDQSLSRSHGAGSTIFSKYTLEMRYPLSLNPSATIYGQVFLEAGNAWLQSNLFNPFDVRRAAGFGVRMNLPMFGLLGIDYAWGFDPLIPDPSGKTPGQFHFFIGQQF